MHIFYVVAIPGTKSAELFSNYDVIPEHKRGSVIFMVRDADANCALAVATAVKEVHDIWLNGPDGQYQNHYTFGSPGNYIRPNKNWNANLPDILTSDEHTEQYYIYSYAAPNNYPEWLHTRNSEGLLGFPSTTGVTPFYIGRGIGERWLAHIAEAMNHVSVENIPSGAHFEYGKILKICEHMIQTAHESCKELVRKIAIFTGEYAQEKYVAAELFLINSVGIYQLKNLTRGDMTAGKTEFIARPKHVNSTPHWIEIVEDFETLGVAAYTQKRSNHLVSLELSHEFPLLLTGPNAVHPQLIKFDTAHANPFETDGTDVFYRMCIVDSENTPIVLMDLKMSDVNPSCAINLRPVPGNKTAFINLIANTFFDGDLSQAETGVRNKTNQPYFKPCAANFNGAQDIWFDFTDIEKPVYRISNCPWIGHGTNWQGASFKDVLLAIVNKFI